jgi:hypothetical protein
VAAVMTAILTLTTHNRVQADAPEIPDLLKEGHKAKERGDWSGASIFYEQAYRLNRNHAEARTHYLLSIRQLLRKYRLADPTFQSSILSPEYKLVYALDFYKNVVSKLRMFYLEPEKVRLKRLFRDGLEELCLDLEDKEFRETYLVKQPISQQKAEELTRSLREWSTDVEFRSEDDVLAQIREVMRKVADSLRGAGLHPNSFKVIIVEFACGACNAQDEYTCYLSPGFPVGGSMTMMEGTVGAWVLEKGVGKIRITGFDGSTLPAVQAALDRLLKEEKVDVILLDLRGCPGGSFEAAVQVAELFLPSHLPIVTTSSNLKEAQRHFESGNLQPTTVPLVVQVDGDTASAAELLAGSLKVNSRAELVGQQTLGKSLIQKTLPVSHAPYGTLQITWARFSLPKTPDLTRHGGIAPDAVAGDNDEVALKRARTLVMR